MIVAGDRVELLYDINTSKGKFKKGTLGEVIKDWTSHKVLNIELYLAGDYNIYEKFKYSDVKPVRSKFQIGDIVIPLDGSSMNAELHKLLFTETSKPFKPVKVLAIEGNLLGVAPLNVGEHWYNPGKQSFWGREEYKKLGEGFWIDKKHVKKSEERFL